MTILFFFGNFGNTISYTQPSSLLGNDDYHREINLEEAFRN